MMHFKMKQVWPEIKKDYQEVLQTKHLGIKNGAAEKSMLKEYLTELNDSIHVVALYYNIVS